MWAHRISGDRQIAFRYNIPHQSQQNASFWVKGCMTVAELKAQLRQQAQGALSLDVAYIGVVNGLFSQLHRLGRATALRLAQEAAMDDGYVLRWCDAAFAFGYLDACGDEFTLTTLGEAMRPEAPDSLMPLAVQSVLSAHMAERAAGLMRTGERPGEGVLAERQTMLPWFGPMLEANFSALFEHTICPQVPAFAAVNARGGLAIDLGCGNGWYLRALLRRCGLLRGLGIDGFEENIRQARELAQREGLQARLQFHTGDIHNLQLTEAADLIAMNRALHHVWENGAHTLLSWLRDQLKPGGFVVIWEPAWPSQRQLLRQPALRGMAFQNLSEHVQGNHFLQPVEIETVLAQVGLPAQTYRFGTDGSEAVIVGQRPA